MNNDDLDYYENELLAEGAEGRCVNCRHQYGIYSSTAKDNINYCSKKCEEKSLT